MIFYCDACGQSFTDRLDHIGTCQGRRIMPNHVTTKFTLEGITGDALAQAQQVFLNDARVVDFNKLMPIPKCLKEFEPHMGIISRAKMALGLLELPAPNPVDLSDFTERLAFSNAMRDATTPAKLDDIPQICRAISNYADCGFMYWYDWCNENWGTKWGAYGQSDDGWPEDATEFEFETAWSHPKQMMILLSERVGNTKISVRYADEDTGSNCGKYTLCAGQISDEDIASPRREMSEADQRKWTEFAFRLTNPNDDPRAYGYDENWVYSDDVYEAYEAARK